MNYQFSEEAANNLQVAEDAHQSGPIARSDVRLNNGKRQQARANWAWMATTERYDWMDSHAPFPSSTPYC